MSVYFKDGDATVAEVGGGGYRSHWGGEKKKKHPKKQKENKTLGAKGPVQPKHGTVL